jgi:PAS domain S-box-containing protein
MHVPQAVRIICVAFLGTVVLCPRIIATVNRPVKVGIGRVFPISYRNPAGELQGFAIDVLNEAARRENITIEWTSIKSSRDSEDDLRFGRIDLLPAGMVTPERQQMFYVSEPWWSTETTLVSRVDDAHGLNRIAINPIYVALAKEALPNAVLVPYTWSDWAIKAVCRSEVDGALIALGELHDIFLNRPEECNGIRMTSGETSASVQLSIIARKADEALASRLRRRIDEMTSDGTLMRMAVKNPPIPTAAVAQFEQRLKDRLNRRVWMLVGSLVAAFLAIFLSNRQRNLTRMKRSEAELRKLHERLALKHEVARIGTFEWIVPENRVVWSREMELLYGISSENHEHTFDEWKVLIHPEDLIPTLDAMNDAITKKQRTVNTTYRIVKPDGAVAWIHSRGQYEYGSSGQPVHMLGVNIDITEQRRAEEAIRETNAQLHAILGAIPEPVTVIDANGNFLLRNDAFSKVIPPEPKLKNFEPYAELRTEAGEPIRPDMWPLNRAIRGERLNDLNLWLQFNDLHPRLYRYSTNCIIGKDGDVTHAIVCQIDITDRKLAEQKLKAAYDTLERTSTITKLAMEAGNSGAWTWSIDTGELFWTEAYHRLLGIDLRVTPTPELFYSVVHPDDVERVKSDIDACLNGAKREFCNEFRINREDGVRWIERRGRILENHKGKPVQLVGISTDVTERKILRGLLSTCAQCKKVRDEHDRWQAVDRYICEHSEAQISHGLCPECADAWAQNEGLEGDCIEGSIS